MPSETTKVVAPAGGWLTRCDLPGHVLMFLGAQRMPDKLTVGESSSKRCRKSLRAGFLLMDVFDAALTLVAL
jgi:hypothetical protein